jgi:hypothetical protein
MTPGPSPVTAPESDPLANVPEAHADRMAPGDVSVGDAPDRTLIGLTVAGAVGGVGLLAAKPFGGSPRRVVTGIARIWRAPVVL